MQDIFDVAIIGAGPSGMTAGIYVARAGKSCVIIEKSTIGGQASLSSVVNNYPGFENIVGSELAEKMFEQTQNLGVETIFDCVNSITKEKDFFILNLKNSTIKARNIILSMGAKARTLDVLGETEYLGKGVCYCAVCDGGLYKGKDVCIVGGGESAVEDAIYLSHICKSTTMIVRHKINVSFTLKSELDECISKGKIKVLENAEITKINGSDYVTSVTLNNGENLAVSGVFIAIGRVPDTEIVRGLVDTDSMGYIVTNENMQTSDPHIFACGDVRHKTIRQIITACGEGAIAGSFASK